MKSDKFSILLKNKKILLLGILVFLILLMIVIYLNSPAKKDEAQSSAANQPFPLETVLTPTLSPELQLAIEEARESAREYDDWQANLRLTYPWLRKLPVASEKYYVYFDLNQEKFIGSLYPQKGDNPENLKAETLRILKEVKEIPIENYQFTWTIKYSP